MALEDDIKELTAAIKEQTTLLKSMRAAKAGPDAGGAAAGTAKATTTAKTTAKPKGPTIETIKARFGAFLGTEDKAERKTRIAQIAAMNAHFGVERPSALDPSQFEEALGYLDQLEAGEEPDYGDEGGGDGALV